MAYFVQHLRFTLECDACGKVEKRDVAAEEQSKGTHGWSEVRTMRGGFFVCPVCEDKVDAILNKRQRDEKEATRLREANCVHDYQPRGLLQQCTKCEKWK
jgi:hypothetical protein